MLDRPDPSTVNRLAKVTARLASSFDGERTTAAAVASRLLADLGLGWQDLVARAFQAPPSAPALPPQVPHAAAVRWASQYKDRLTDRERKFLADIGRCRRISAKQAAWLADIVAKLRQGGAT